MIRFSVIILVFTLIITNCSNSTNGIGEIENPKIEIPEAKKFVLGKWIYKRILPNPEGRPWQKKINESIEKSKPPILYLIFREDNVLVFVNCMPGECEENELPYKINENGFIEIDAKGEEPLIVKKIGENEIKLEPRVASAYKSPPMIFFFHDWIRLNE